MKQNGQAENEQDLCVPSLFSVLVRDKARVLRSGKLLSPSVVLSQIKQIEADEPQFPILIYFKDQYSQL